jgi:pSer/pThr/pTyr-binding forkhead associated (FHA) protein
MPEVRLSFGEREFLMGAGITTIGRTPDNFISFPDDSNVSRYHAEIESRDADYCLIDLNSSNGTTVNGKRVTGETYLSDGDVIVLGGSSEIRVEFVKDRSERALPEAASVAAEMPAPAASAKQVPADPAADTAPAGGSGKLLLVGGIVCVAAVLAVGVVAGVYYFGGSSCTATAVITSPELGDTLNKPTEVNISLKNGGCVIGAIYTINGKEFASSDEEPYSVPLDPRRFPELSDGAEHALGVVLVDKNNNLLPQSGAVLIAFDTRKLTKPEPEPEIVKGPQQTAGPSQAKKEVSLIDLQQMTNGLVKQFSGGRSYNVSNPQFLKEVQKRTAEYTREGYFEKAVKFRDPINLAYARENNLDAALGYMLAMSRSQFDPSKQGNLEGIWRMSSDFATANGYLGQCGSETLSDPSQNCAAKASAQYMKAMVFGVFDGDVIISAAVFGKSTEDAGKWLKTLPANRTDVWNAIRTAPEREQLVRFFAAGVVAENPQKFGLGKDRPLSELYRLTM